MKCDVANRQTKLVRCLGHPLLNHGEKHGAGLAGRIQEFDDVHFGRGVANRWRMFARKSCQACIAPGLRRLVLLTQIDDQHGHDSD